MDQYSILDGASENPPLHPLTIPPPLRQSTEELQFPGEDGGESLASWARRDLEATLQLLADRAQYITGGSGAAIALRDGENIICRASSGPSAPEVGSYLQVSSGLSGESVRSKKVLRCDDASADPRVNHESCRALGIASFAVMPLLRDGEVVGIFEIFSGKPRAFQERDLLALERMGEMVNTALDQVGDARPRFVPGLGVQDILFGSEEATAVAPVQVTEPPNFAEPALSRLETLVKMAEAAPVVASEKKPATETFPSEVSRPASPAAIFSEPLPERPKPIEGGIRTCVKCGFPVSSGRTLCLDCEAATPVNSFAAAAGTPAFLTGLSEEAKQTGVKHWISKNRYLIGTVLFAAATIALLLLR